MSRPLVIGASGLLGGHLLALQPKAVGTFRTVARAGLRQLDIGDRTSSVRLLRELRPPTVIISANPRTLEWCETNQEASRREQVDDLRRFLDDLQRQSPDASVVFFSTDYVFDGTAAPYREGDPTHPLQCYGRHKRAAEEVVAASGLRHWIVRTSVLYGENHWELEDTSRLPLQVVSAAREGRPLRATDNLWSRPTEVRGLAEVAWALADRQGGGVLHAAGGPSVTRRDLVAAILESWSVPTWPRIEVVSADREGRIPGQTLRRPRDSSLDSSLLQGLVGRPLPSLQEGLRTVRERLKRSGRS